MHNFGTLLGFELKKLLINKITILTADEAKTSK